MNQTPTEVQQNVTPSVRQRLDKRSFSLWRFSYPILQANKVPPRQAATTDGLRVGFATDFPAVASPHAESLTNSQPHTRPSRHTVNVSGCGPVCYWWGPHTSYLHHLHTELWAAPEALAALQGTRSPWQPGRRHLLCPRLPPSSGEGRAVSKCTSERPSPPKVSFLT